MNDLLGLVLLGAAAFGTTTMPAADTRVPYSIEIIEGVSGRLYCLRPEPRGKATLPVTKLPRRACRKGAQWAQRGVELDDEAEPPRATAR